MKLTVIFVLTSVCGALDNSHKTTNAANTACPNFTCPGQCSIGIDNGCQVCTCSSDVKIGAGLDKKLDDVCLNSIDCAAAYSFCKSNKCTCIDGFSASNEVCKPPVLQCPTWKDQSTSTPGKACEHYVNYSSNVEFHTCDNKTEFCFVHPKEHSENGRNVGHCCPKPPAKVDDLKLVCPYVGSGANGSCPDLSNFPADAPIPSNQARTCSYVTHECIRHFKRDACCPIPCTGASSHFSVKGKCFDYVQIGEVCENDAVCIGGSHCLNAGSGKPLCRCPKKTCNEPSQHCCE